MRPSRQKIMHQNEHHAAGQRAVEVFALDHAAPEHGADDDDQQGVQRRAAPHEPLLGRLEQGERRQKTERSARASRRYSIRQQVKLQGVTMP